VIENVLFVMILGLCVIVGSIYFVLRGVLDVLVKLNRRIDEIEKI